MINTAVSILKIDSANLDRVQRLAMDIWPKCYRNIITPDKIDVMLATLYNVDHLESEMRDGGQVFWIAQVRGLDVGYASAFQDGDTLWLKKLYVMDDFRGQSIGKAFMAEALAQFPSAKRLSLYVNHDNLPAITYYLKTGFVKDREEPVTMGPFDFVDFVMTEAI